jgi:very-short-patch-repair endonuclease
MRHDPLTSALVHAQAQHGVLTVPQLRAIGLSKDRVAALVRRGVLTRIRRGTYVVAGHEPTYEQRVFAAWCSVGEGAVVGRRSAAVLWRLEGVRPDAVDILTSARFAPVVPGVKVVRTSRLRASEVCSWPDGLVVTRPARTLLDLASVLPGPVLSAAYDDAVVRKLVTPAQAREALATSGGRGRPGTTAFRLLLEDDDRSRSESRLELRLQRLLVRGGLPEPVRQVPLTVPGHGAIRVDLAYPDLRIAIEADGRSEHERRQQADQDARRDAALTAMGWASMRFRFRTIEREPGWIVDVVRRARVERSQARSA